jgi:chemotaxis protein methyltransferase CheR
MWERHPAAMYLPENHPIRGKMPLPHKIKSYVDKQSREMDDHQFIQLLDFFNRSWKGYRKVRKGVKKRITRHMQAAGCRQLKAYLHLLEEDKTARKTCELLLTVSISRFFRDRRVWEMLREELLPEMTAGRTDPLKLLSAGCARGEEVYSFRIIWEELKRLGSSLPQLQITAADMNAGHLAQANTGRYTRGSVKEVSEQLKARYFEKRKGGRRWCIRPELKTGIDWECRDFTVGKWSPGPFDIIFLRNNLLTYYKDPERNAALKKVIETLVPGGVLIIGAHESLPGNNARLSPLAGSELIFRNPG